MPDSSRKRDEAEALREAVEAASAAIDRSAVKVTEMSAAIKKVRQVYRVHIGVCADGHVVSADTETREKAWQITCHRCEGWTWEDGNFCVNCGVRL